MSNLEQQERERTGIKTLKVRYNKVFGYYIEVGHAQQALVPEDYVRKQTLANAERYITVELKEKEQLLLTGEEQQKDCEKQLYKQLTQTIADYLPLIQSCATVVADCDVLQSLGHVAQNGRYTRPKWLDDDAYGCEILGSRHPILEQQQSTPFIPNDIVLNAEHPFMLITGPNMAGKSTVMRQVALTVIMAQIGSFVPARLARLSLVDQVFTRIGASDNLSAGQSTFMVEMVETARILNNATQQSLVILDEIGRGTSTFDGISIAASVCVYLLETIQARTLFATHYHELTELSEKYSGCQNYSMKISEQQDQLVFMYQLQPGPADKSYGLVVAQMAGLPASVLDSASKTLAHLESQAIHGLSPKSDGRQLTLFQD